MLGVWTVLVVTKFLREFIMIDMCLAIENNVKQVTLAIEIMLWLPLPSERPGWSPCLDPDRGRGDQCFGQPATGPRIDRCRPRLPGVRTYAHRRGKSGCCPTSRLIQGMYKFVLSTRSPPQMHQNMFHSRNYCHWRNPWFSAVLEPNRDLELWE